MSPVESFDQACKTNVLFYGDSQLTDCTLHWVCDVGQCDDLAVKIRIRSFDTDPDWLSDTGKTIRSGWKYPVFHTPGAGT